MIHDYISRAKPYIKWLLPFFLAVFFLFGCGGKPGQAELEQLPGQHAAEVAGTSQEGVFQGEPGQKHLDGKKHDSESENTSDAPGRIETSWQEEEKGVEIEKEGDYTSKEDVALYLHLYGELPGNFITKSQAEAAGWNSREGNLWEVAPGKSIGGSRFGNYEGRLPQDKNRVWYECDINYEGGYRGAERIIYSNDGLIYYTSDHYATFEQLY